MAMIMRIWSESADRIHTDTGSINTWIRDNEKNDYIVVDKTVTMASHEMGGSTSFSKEPWVCITIWMEKRGLDVRGLGR